MNFVHKYCFTNLLTQAIFRLYFLWRFKRGLVRFQFILAINLFGNVLFTPNSSRCTLLGRIGKIIRIFFGRFAISSEEGGWGNFFSRSKKFGKQYFSW